MHHTIQVYFQTLTSISTEQPHLFSLNNYDQLYDLTLVHNYLVKTIVTVKIIFSYTVHLMHTTLRYCLMI